MSCSQKSTVGKGLATMGGKYFNEQCRAQLTCKFLVVQGLILVLGVGQLLRQQLQLPAATITDQVHGRVRE